MMHVNKLKVKKTSQSGNRLATRRPCLTPSQSGKSYLGGLLDSRISKFPSTSQGEALGQQPSALRRSERAIGSRVTRVRLIFPRAAFRSLGMTANADV